MDLVTPGLSHLAEPGTDKYVLYAIHVCFLAGRISLHVALHSRPSCTVSLGLIQLAMGFLNLGFLVRFLSHPVTEGFTMGAAAVIAASQIPGLLGLLHVGHAQSTLVMLYNIIGAFLRMCRPVDFKTHVVVQRHWSTPIG